MNVLMRRTNAKRQKEIDARMRTWPSMPGMRTFVDQGQDPYLAYRVTAREASKLVVQDAETPEQYTVRSSLQALMDVKAALNDVKAAKDAADEAGRKFNELAKGAADAVQEAKAAITQAEDAMEGVNEAAKAAQAAGADASEAAKAAHDASENASAAVSAATEIADETRREIAEIRSEISQAGEAGGQSQSIDAIMERLDTLISMFRYGEAFVSKVGDFAPPERPT